MSKPIFRYTESLGLQVAGNGDEDEVILVTLNPVHIAGNYGVDVVVVDTDGEPVPGGSLLAIVDGEFIRPIAIDGNIGVQTTDDGRIQEH